jgi:hypothetical protein
VLACKPGPGPKECYASDSVVCIAIVQVFLADREKKILMVVIPLQVMAEVAIIVLDEDTPAARNWFTWMNILHLVRGAAMLK